MFDDEVSSSGASPVTVTVSCSDDTFSSKFKVACRPSSNSTPGLTAVVNPPSSTLIL